MTTNFKNFHLILLLFIATNIYAQNEIKWGAKAGVNFSEFHTGNSAYTDAFRISIGDMTEYELSKTFSIQAELLYNAIGGRVAGNTTNQNDFGFDARLNYLDIPIQVKFYFMEKICFDCGTQMGFLISEKGKFDSGEELNDIGAENIDLFINGGFSYRFESDLIIQTRYNFGLSEVFENERYKNSLISLSEGTLLIEKRWAITNSSFGRYDLT